jgi:hypothetical protein
VLIAFASPASFIGILKAYSLTVAVSEIGHGITLNGLVAIYRQLMMLTSNGTTTQEHILD